MVDVGSMNRQSDNLVDLRERDKTTIRSRRGTCTYLDDPVPLAPTPSPSPSPELAEAESLDASQSSTQGLKTESTLSSSEAESWPTLTSRDINASFKVFDGLAP